MRRVINLTIPFYPFMPVGNVWPQDPSFRPRPIMTHAEQGVRVDYLAVHSESGTRIMTKATYDPKFPKIGEIDLGQLVDMPTVVVDIPKKAGEEITAADIDARVTADPEYRTGDAILIRTGWGDDERFRKMGDAYTTTTPHFCDEGATARRRFSASMSHTSETSRRTTCAPSGLTCRRGCGRRFLPNRRVATCGTTRPTRV